ncbi:MAG TPA: TonB-dependent receptor [Hanamia sp.]|nr:TonB-dependent receptor [Hanamia sp.]
MASLLKLSLEDLMNIKVTSVSKNSEKLEEAASAIQVITQADIHNSGAKTLPEALRLASNLQVAQVNSSQWAISARGFNNVLANKLLVLINGRAVYTPMYAGVFWDVQNVLLEDIDRIEVISGPGGALWGSNAVNGVINVITKSSKDTKGFYAEAGAGSNLPGTASLRYGGKLNDKITYRMFGAGFHLGNTQLTNGSKANDEWTMGRAGLRMDWDVTPKDLITFEGSIYSGRPNPDGNDTSIIARGDNLTVRWSHSASARSDFQLQFYYDHTLRNFGNGFKEVLKTYDIDWQNRIALCDRHEVTYGANFRIMDHNVTNLPLFGFFPGRKDLYLYSAFAQDKIALIKDRLRFTIGAKIEHNSYTDFEFQPNARLAFTPTKKQTIWAAVSQAVRTPSRIDRDFVAFLAPGLAFIRGDSNFVSETLTAYELGWRIQPSKNLSVSASSFYNVYDNIRSAEPGPIPPFNIPITFGNGVKGASYGIELSGIYQLTSWWNLKGGYTFFKKDLSLKSGSKDANNATAESDDPQHQFVIQSKVILPARFEFGTVIRYIDKLPKPYVPSYFGLDLRVGWRPSKAIELNLVAQNLLDKYHSEFIPASPSAREIERSIYGKVTCRF